MSTINLHYHELGKENGRSIYVCDSMDQVQKTVFTLLSQTSKGSDIVHLLSVNGEVYISEDRPLIISILKELYSNYTPKNIFLLEYGSFDRAYEDAFFMKNPSRSYIEELFNTSYKIILAPSKIW